MNIKFRFFYQIWTKWKRERSPKHILFGTL